MSTLPTPSTPDIHQRRGSRFHTTAAPLAWLHHTGRCLGLFVWMLCLWGCTPPTPPAPPAPPAPPTPPDTPTSQEHPLYRIWQRDGRGWLQAGKALSALTSADFPLTLSIAAMRPDSPLPHPLKATPSATHIQLKQEQLQAPIALLPLAAEAAITLRTQQGRLLDWTSWVGFPADTVLQRTKTQEIYCQQTTSPTETQPCQRVHRGQHTPLSRLRHIRSPEEFAQLTKRYGDMGLQTEVIKFVIDKRHDDQVHFFSAVSWSLHFTFVWEVLRQQAHLDTCKGEDYKVFWREYQAFHKQNSASETDRPYSMGTLIFYPGAKLYSLEFEAGYGTPAADMVLVYQRIRQAITPEIDLRLRPKSEQQKAEIKAAPGGAALPMWPSEAPYQGERIQLLSPGVAFGTLQQFTNAQLATASLGLQVIALLQDVPNDISFVGGLLSAQFQSPLSHINVLSRNRGTPHLVIKAPLQDKQVAALLGKLVRLEVTNQGYTLEAASRQDAEAFWQAQRGKRKPFVPQRNLSQKALVDLADVDHNANDSIGAKAANLAELARVSLRTPTKDRLPSACDALAQQHELAPTPFKPFAIPFFWYVDHIQRAGIADAITQAHQQSRLRDDPAYRRTQLDLWRDKILSTPINPTLLQPLREKIKARYGEIKVRFRSSTNVEDLPNFNGAGLYTSKSGQLNHDTKTIELALRTVWASLWSDRAWTERDFYQVKHDQVAMAVLVHPSFPDEDANGVAVSANVFVSYGDPYDTYIVAQKGEVSIVNPDTDATPEQFLLRWSDPLQFLYLSRSSLTPNKTVLSRDESILLGCYMRAIHEHFAPYVVHQGKPFAMEAEFKILPSPRRLLLKQTRPYIFGEEQAPRPTCRD